MRNRAVSGKIGVVANEMHKNYNTEE